VSVTDRWCPLLSGGTCPRCAQTRSSEGIRARPQSTGRGPLVLATSAPAAARQAARSTRLDCLPADRFPGGQPCRHEAVPGGVAGAQATQWRWPAGHLHLGRVASSVGGREAVTCGSISQPPRGCPSLSCVREHQWADRERPGRVVSTLRGANAVAVPLALTHTLAALRSSATRDRIGRARHGPCAVGSGERGILDSLAAISFASTRSSPSEVLCARSL
jgi:hypothetical protein